MKTITNEMLQEIIDRIVEVAHPEKIIMFGSSARKEMNHNSDVDILVIKNGDFDYYGLLGEIYMNLFGVGIGVDVILATAEQVEKYKNINYLIIAPAIREGKEVYHA
jgi:uncharacterized protein